MGVNSSENVGVALAMVFGAGASTGLGAAVVFFPSIVKLASQRVLATSLGFSAGVMIYVSFVEIFSKASIGFADAGYAANEAYIYATACFFAGVVLMIVRDTWIEWFIALLQRCNTTVSVSILSLLIWSFFLLF